MLLRLVEDNKIVSGKVAREYEEICRSDAASSEIADLRMVFHSKMSVLSDVLAALRLVPQKMQHNYDI